MKRPFAGILVRIRPIKKGTQRDSSMNIVLTGYRCCGKSSVGKLLAQKMRRDFLDTDLLIEAYSGKGIGSIVRENGWEYFRRIEQEVVEKTSQKNGKVIATGGGVVINKKNVENLKKSGFIVWLKAGREVIANRMDNDAILGNKRPSLTGEGPQKEIEKILMEREPYYKRASDLEIDTDGVSVQEVAGLIIKKLPKDIIGQDHGG